MARIVLPPGVRIERIYDRKDLIDVTTHTVLHNMVIGIVLIFLLQWVFLGNLRSAIIVGATIPFALFFAIGIMVLRGESANLLSVGAIDFGLIVDATVLMVESIFRRLGHAGPVSDGAPPSAGLSGKLGAIFQAGTVVSRSIFFAAGIIIAGFIPLFTLSGVEGHIFGPMAKTYAYALAGGLLATFTITPALSAVILPERVRETETIAVRTLHRLYTPILRLALANRLMTLLMAIGLLIATGVVVRALGLEFLPKLEEGNLWIRATMPSTISLEEGNGYVNRMRQVISGFPEVELVVSQHGRPDDGTDAAGFFNAEFFAPLRPVSEWRQGLQKDELTNEILVKLKAVFPGRRVQFLTISARQRRGSNLRCEGRELDQACRQRSAIADDDGQQDQIGARNRSGYRRSRRVHLSRATDGADRHRSRTGGALRADAGRHQRDYPCGDRRGQRGRPV